ENVSRHVSEGEKPLVAAYTGAREITTAVASSTLTTVAVFLPIVFLTGIAGSFFRPFALTVVVALLASLVVAVTVVPFLAAYLLPATRADKTERRLPYNWMQRAYVPAIRWATGHRWIALGIAVLFFAGSMALIPLLRVNLLDQSSSPQFPIAITSQMQVDVSASDPGALRDANASVMIALAKVHGVANLKSNLVASKPQYQLVPTDRLAASGLTVQQLALIVAQDVNGVVATQAVLPQGPVSVRVVLPPGTADTAASLAKIPIPTLAGVVPLSSLATLQLVNGPQAVSRLNGDRDATITGTITGNNTQAVQSDVSKALNG